jgi:hypothetical protein
LGERWASEGRLTPNPAGDRARVEMAPRETRLPGGPHPVSFHQAEPTNSAPSAQPGGGERVATSKGRPSSPRGCHASHLTARPYRHGAGEYAAIGGFTAEAHAALRMVGSAGSVPYKLRGRGAGIERSSARAASRRTGSIRSSGTSRPSTPSTTRSSPEKCEATDCHSRAASSTSASAFSTRSRAACAAGGACSYFVPTPPVFVLPSLELRHMKTPPERGFL